MKPRLFLVPLELAEANDLVRLWHRHHQPTVGHRFSIGLIDADGVPHGACIVGRPVARQAGHPRTLAEVTRLVTDGTPNACSMLYAAAARACKAPAGGGQWKHTDGKPRRTDQPISRKGRWSLVLNPSRPRFVPFVADEHPTLWGAA